MKVFFTVALFSVVLAQVKNNSSVNRGTEDGVLCTFAPTQSPTSSTANPTATLSKTPTTAPSALLTTVPSALPTPLPTPSPTLSAQGGHPSKTAISLTCS